MIEVRMLTILKKKSRYNIIDYKLLQKHRQK